MRGRTLDNAFVILDEAQNTNPFTNEDVLTRMGKSANLWLPEILVRWICQEGQFQD
jgi:phosphate starvation-inducible protein PhoH